MNVSWTFLSSKLDSPVIKTLERHFFTLSGCLSNILIIEESDFDERNGQMPNVSFVRKYVPNFFQNPNFKSSNITLQDPTRETQGGNL